MANWRLWIENAPRISPLEVVLLAAAVLFLYVVPFVLAWSDGWRRRRVERAALAAQIAESAAAAAPVFAAASEPHLGEPAAQTSEYVVPVVPAENAIPEPAMEELSTVEAQGSPEGRSTVALVEIHPLEGPTRHRFRLDELHRAGLPDWPPEAVRNDPGRHRTWGEAEQIVEHCWDRIRGVVIASPYPARSACLAAAETDGGCFRVRFLLFPVLWPVTADQAVAQAIFEIDPVAGPIRGWVDALRATELNAEHRREILASGGEA